MSEYISAFPSVNTVAMFMFFVVIPPVIVGCTMRMVWHRYHWRGGFWKRVVSNFAVVLNHYSPLLVIVNLFLAIIVFLNQGAFVLNYYVISSDVKYYLRVDRPEFDYFNAIFNAQALNSVRAIRQQTSLNFRRRLQTVDDDVEVDLQASPLNFLYHYESFENVLDEQSLVDICFTELNIKTNVSCLTHNTTGVFNSHHSFMPTVFDTNTCEFLIDYNSARPYFGNAVYEKFFSDGTMYSAATSPVVISYSYMNECGNQYDRHEFAELLSNHTVGDIKVAFASFEFLNSEFRDATEDARSVVFWSTIFAYIFLVFSCRGFITSLVTLFCIGLSVVNGAAMLPWLGYDDFSTFNVMGFLVMYAIGCGYVHFYGVAWRHEVKRGKNASVHSILEIFDTVGAGNLLTFFACILAFFTAATARMIFMSQIGFFLGFSIITYFIAFHYIVIPVWVWTSWYCLPESWHHNWRIFRQKYCFCLLVSKHEHHSVTGPQHTHHHHHDHHHQPDSNSVSSSGSSSSSSSSSGSSSASESVVAAVVAPDQVRFVSEGESKTVEATAVPTHVDADGNEIAMPIEDDPAELVEVGAGESNRSQQQQQPEAAAPAPQEKRTLLSRLGRTPLKMFGIIMLILTLIIMILGIVLTQAKMDTRLGETRLIDAPSDLATCFEIFLNYRSDVFFAVDNDNTATIEVDEDQLIQTPTAAPTPFVLFFPTPAPTTAPSAIPTLSGVPTPAPTTHLTRGYIDYVVTGCWGLRTSKTYYDSGVDPEFDYQSFREYTDSGDIVKDMEALCTYVDDNRESLHIHPEWVRSRDCIYDQYQSVVAGGFFFNVTNNPITTRLLVWGLQIDTSAPFIGLLGNSTGDDAIPVWICANFTARTEVNTFYRNQATGVTQRDRWEKAFYDHGSNYAASRNIGTMITSPQFTYPLLGTAVTEQIIFVAIIFSICFAGLLLLFTWLDFGITFFGAFGMYTVYIVTICCALYCVSDVLDLGDVVALMVLLPFMVCFTSHLIVEYMHNRFYFRNGRHPDPSLQRFYSPALAKTNRYIRKALTGPVVVTILCAYPFTNAEYPLLRRLGGYFMVSAVVSWAFCLFLQPYLLSLSYRGHCFDCCWEDDEDDPPPRPADSGIAMVPVGGGGGGTTGYQYQHQSQRGPAAPAAAGNGANSNTGGQPQQPYEIVDGDGNQAAEAANPPHDAELEEMGPVPIVLQDGVDVYGQPVIYDPNMTMVDAYGQPVPYDPNLQQPPPDPAVMGGGYEAVGYDPMLMPAPGYDDVQQYDEYGRPLQPMMMPMQMMQPQPPMMMMMQQPPAGSYYAVDNTGGGGGGAYMYDDGTYGYDNGYGAAPSAAGMYPVGYPPQPAAAAGGQYAPQPMYGAAAAGGDVVFYDAGGGYTMPMTMQDQQPADIMMPPPAETAFYDNDGGSGAPVADPAATSTPVYMQQPPPPAPAPAPAPPATRRHAGGMPSAYADSFYQTD
mmetsp:Transcript_31225/g.52208  ORF Transcript_31225/g.52208 Transcript_31225/m.52208 type:complete len:1462 (+) Transcript_31225:102-4487(+)